MSIITAELPHFGIWHSLHIQKRIIGALILRDMKTRFGRSHVGYLIAIAWPLSHMLLIMGAQFVTARVTPIGTDLTVFAGTGILPYILCLYPARMMTLAIMVNQPLLLFSIVKTTDMIIARAILEILTSCVVAMIFMFVLYAADVDFQPIDISEAVFAVLASIYVGISIGTLNAVLYMLFRQAWMIIFILIMIAGYSTSGAFVLSSNLSLDVRNVLWFNPIFQCVEWLRSAYYDGYGSSSLSKIYVLGFASVCLFLGVLGEKLFRGRFYQR